MIAIITARGGSKRIPKKNIKDFMGKPMLAYAIEAAKESGIFDELMVSTDSEEIAEVAKRCGAVVPFMRSKETSSDFATTYDVLEEVLAEYGKQGKKFNTLCCIYPCVPFLTAKTLVEAYSQFTKNSADALQPVCKYPAPVEWAMRIENGFLIPDDRKSQSLRSQDLSPRFYDAGMFYFLKTDVMLEEMSITPKNTLGYVIDEAECQDIDTPDDWRMAELKYKILRKMQDA